MIAYFNPNVVLFMIEVAEGLKDISIGDRKKTEYLVYYIVLNQQN